MFLQFLLISTTLSLEYQFQAGSTLFPTTLSPGIQYQRNSFGIYMHNDAVEALASSTERFDMTNMPFIMELFFYSCKNSSFYVYSTSDYKNVKEEYFSIFVDAQGYYTLSILLVSNPTQPHIRNTGIKASPGFTYIVFMIDKYGIGSTPRLRISFYVRNSNILGWLTSTANGGVGTIFSYQESDLVGNPVSPFVGTTKYLFGHKGEMSLVVTSLFMNGIFGRFKTTESVSTPMTQAWVDSQWASLYVKANPTTLMSYLSSDLNYIAKLDFLNLQSDGQVIPDTLDATFSSTSSPQYGTNSLTLGLTINVDTTDPLLVPNQGVLFTSGVFAYGASKIQMTSAQQIDYTVEVWYKLNTFTSPSKGIFQSLIYKGTSTVADFGIQISDKSARIMFMGQNKDVPLPSQFYNTSARTFNRTIINSINSTLIYTINQEWRMIAVNFRRSQQIQSNGAGSTQAYVYFDLESPVEVVFPGLVYSQNAANSIYVGKDFEGIIRSIFIYSHFPLCTYFAQNSNDSNNYYEYNRQQYEFLQINNLASTNPTCLRQSYMQLQCNMCSKHQISTTYPSNYCYTTCPLNTYGQSCQDCNSNCLFCSSYLPSDCLQCFSDDSTQPVYTNQAGQCTRDYGYYRNTSMLAGTYAKCDSRCLICTDSTNYCERCVLGAYKVDGSYCVWKCPAGYVENSQTGLCQVDINSFITQNLTTVNITLNNDNPNNLMSYLQLTYLNNDLPFDNSRLCSMGKYFDIGSRQCLACNPNCLTCNGGGDNFCTSCSINFYLSLFDSKCKLCNTTSMSQIFSPGPLSQCNEICGKGLNFGQLECDDGNQISGDGCSQNCKVEQGWICSGGNQNKPDSCIYQNTVFVGITATEQNQLLLEFSRQIIINFTTSNRILGSISNTNNNYSLTNQLKYNIKNSFSLYLLDTSSSMNQWTEYIGDWGFPYQFLSQSNFPTKIIPIYTDFNQTGFDYSNYKVKVTLSTQTQTLILITDINNQPLNFSNQQYYTAITTLNKIDVEQASIQLINQDNFDQISIYSTLVVFFMISSLVMSLIQAAIIFKPISLAISTFLTLQQFYMTYLIDMPNLYLQQYLTIYLQAFKFTLFSWNFNHGQSIMKDMFINDFTQFNVYGQTFTDAGYYYNNTLYNLSLIIWFWIIYYVAFVPTSFIVGLILKKRYPDNNKLMKIALALQNKLVFSASSLLFIVMALPIILPALQELNYLHQNSQNSIDQQWGNDLTLNVYNSQIGSILVLSLVILGFIWLFITQQLNSQIISDEKIKLAYGSLFSPFRNDIRAYSLNPLYILKGIFTAIIIVQIQDSWQTQTNLLALLNLLMGLYILFIRPFKQISFNMIATYLEFFSVGHFLAFYFTQLFLSQQSQPSSNQYYTSLQIVMFYDTAGSFVLFVGMSYDTVISLYKYYYWTQTGKFPSRFGKWYSKAKLKKQNDIGKSIVETSSIGLLENQSLNPDKDKSNSQNYLKPSPIPIKNNTFLEIGAINLDQSDQNTNKNNNKISKQHLNNISSQHKANKLLQQNVNDQVQSLNTQVLNRDNLPQSRSEIVSLTQGLEDPQSRSIIYDQILMQKIKENQKAQSEIQLFSEDQQVAGQNQSKQDKEKMSQKVVDKKKKKKKHRTMHNVSNGFAVEDEDSLGSDEGKGDDNKFKNSNFNGEEETLALTGRKNNQRKINKRKTK